MWKQLLSVFTDCGLCQEAFDEALLMLRASHGMHRDSVAALRGEGILVTDIYERDRQLNKYERSVRRKILTHLAVSPKADLNSGLVITRCRPPARPLQTECASPACLDEEASATVVAV